MEEQAKNMEAMLQMIRELKEGSPRDDSEVSSHLVSSNRRFGMSPKLEFPKFDGNNSRMWIKKCDRYFKLCKIPDENRVDLAALHMIDNAETWIISYLSVRHHVDWNDFIFDLTARFKAETGSIAVEQFNKLTQSFSLEEYIDSFEHLRSIMLQNGHCLSDSFLLDCFVGGLKPTIKSMVRAFKPTSIFEAIEQARHQEDHILNQAPQKTYKPPEFQIYNPRPLQSDLAKYPVKTPLLPTPQNKLPPSAIVKYNQQQIQHIPADIKAQKIAKGLCYYCDQKFDRNHKCPFREPKLFMIEIPPINFECEADFHTTEELQEEDTGDAQILQISINALSGNIAYNNMRVVGWAQGKPVHILIDSGSTHNFLDLALAKDLGCQIEEISPQSITVADGNHIPCQHKCAEFK